jgi:hypothetical protein
MENHNRVVRKLPFLSSPRFAGSRLKNPVLLCFIFGSLFFSCGKEQVPGEIQGHRTPKGIGAETPDVETPDTGTAGFEDLSAYNRYFFPGEAGGGTAGEPDETLKTLIDEAPVKVNLIGWTPEGTVIVKYQDRTERWGGAVYLVIDAVEDDYLCSILYSEARESYYSVPAEPGRYITREETEHKWAEILNKYNIAGSPPLNNEFTGELPLEFPCIHEGVPYYAWFEYDIEELDVPVESESNYSDEIYSYKCVMDLYAGNKEMEKSICRWEYLGEDTDFSWLGGRKIIGYYKSPYENRIVVVVLFGELYRYQYDDGTTEESFLYSYGFFGCNLNRNVGFVPRDAPDHENY